MASISPPPPPRATPTGRNSVSERVSELHHPLSTNTTTTTITTTTNAYIRIYIYIRVSVSHERSYNLSLSFSLSFCVHASNPRVSVFDLCCTRNECRVSPPPFSLTLSLSLSLPPCSSRAFPLSRRARFCTFSNFLFVNKQSRERERVRPGPRQR